jgi:glycosyltransferase involved in cell wall biosynthesis
MGYWPNERAAWWLATEIFPRIRKRAPGARLVLAGRKPSARLSALDGKDGIRVLGFVEDSRDCYRAASVFVCPLRHGTGIKNKVLEAMAMKLPVVGTTMSFNGIPVQHGREVLMADDAEEMARASEVLLGNSELRERLADAAHAFVRRYGIGEVRERFLKVAEASLA